MKRLSVIAVALVCILALLPAYSCGGKSEADAPQPRQVKPTRGPIAKTVAASGGVTSNLDVEIKCKASGTVTSLPFDIGDSVVEGELIVMLDPSDEERNVELARINLYESQARRDRAEENLENSERDLATAREQARISLDAAQARSDQAQANYDHVVELFDKGFASQDEKDQAYTALQTAKADLEGARVRFRELDDQEAALDLLRHDVNLAGAEVQASEISLETANQRLDDTRVYAPMNGYVTARFVQAGQIISSGISATSGGTAVMKLSDLSRLFILARVDESNIGQVGIGQRVTINVDAFPQEKFSGEVVRMARAGENVSNVVTFEVRIEVTSDNKSFLMPEMTADVEIVIAENMDALQVPSGAVTVSDGKSTVNVLGADGQPVPREVVTGIDNGESVEIVSGLSETDIVLVSNNGQASQWRQPSNERHGPPPGMIGIH